MNLRKRLISLFILLITGCSTSSFQNLPNATIEREPATISNDSNCSALEDSLSSAEISDRSICLYAKNYFQMLTNGRSQIEVQPYTIPMENPPLTLKIIIQKNDLEEVLGHGGMRIRYMRYILNELSIAKTTQQAIKNQQKISLQKFTPIELILDIKEN